MLRTIKIAALASVLAIGAGPSFAEDAIPLVIPPEQLLTTVTTDVNKGVAEFNPTEILTPKPIEAPAAAPAPKVKKKRYAKKRSRKMAKK